MGELLIKNGLIVTVDGERQIYRNGSIRVVDDRIAEIGPAKDVEAQTPDCEVIDATQQVVIPGFVSCHNHLYSAVVRSIPFSGFADTDFSFIAWMEQFWLPLLEDRVTRDQMYVGTLANCLEHIRSGITTTTDTAEGSYALPGALDYVDRGATESGIRAVLSLQRDIEVVGEAVDGQDGVKKALQLSPDVVLMDIVMPIMSGLEATEEICKECPQSKVLILTQYDDRENQLTTKQAGASGFIPKQAASSQLLDGIRSVYEGKPFHAAIAA